MLSGADFCPESIASGGICTERTEKSLYLSQARDGRLNRPVMKSGAVSLQCLRSGSLHPNTYYVIFAVAKCDLKLISQFNKRNNMTKKNNTQTSEPISNCDNISQSSIESLIISIHGVPVILDRDLAALYQEEVRQMNRQVKRNIKRFPADFMFQLTKEEYDGLKCQNGTSNIRGGDRRALPYVFTEQGVSMLSGLLRSDKAIEINILIMRAFVAMRRFLVANAQVFQRLERIEYKQLETDHKFEQVFAKLEEKALAPKQGIFFDGQVYDAYDFVCGLIRIAKVRIILIDNYVDETVLTMLDKREDGISATIYTKQISEQFNLDLVKHNAQYAPIEVHPFNKAHDRFLIIDEQIYHIGASLKDLGKKWFAFSLMNDITPFELLSKIGE